MSILSKLTKLGAIVALTASIVALPAAAQYNGGFKTVTKAKTVVSVDVNRGANIRTQQSRNFNGNRNFNNNRNFSNRRIASNNRNFNNNRDINRQVVRHQGYNVGGFYNVHNNSVFINNARSRGLYSAPRGYRWVSDRGSNNAILAAVATGAIIAIVANNQRYSY